MRFGELQAFGSIVFAGVGAVSQAVSGWPTEFSASYDTGLIGVGRPFPVDTQGLSAAPMKDPCLTYEYILYAGIGVPANAAFAQLEAQWLSIYAALQGTYAWADAAGAATSGQKGTLVVADADLSVSTVYTAPARIMKPAPWKLQKGQPYALSVELTFCLLDDFTGVGAGGSGILVG